jgi:spore maturation protein CgeB
VIVDTHSNYAQTRLKEPADGETRKMKMLIVDTWYPGFMKTITPVRGTYGETIDRLMKARFGTSDAYSHYLAPHDIEAREVIANCRELQEAWGQEHGLPALRTRQTHVRWRRGWIPWISRGDDKSWIWRTLTAQIEHYQPDVVFVHDVNAMHEEWLSWVKSRALLVGQIGSPIRKGLPLGLFDMVLTSLPAFVDQFRAMRVNVRPFRLGFDSRILAELNGPEQKDIDVSFVGGLNPDSHADTLPVLERLASEHGLQWWGYGIDNLPKASPLRAAYRGEAWGIAMYRIFGRSRITVNRHAWFAGPYANNMRLYEATGVGTLLLTDRKIDLADTFLPESEVASYGSTEEASERVTHFLSCDADRETIASAGQARTLRDHTYSVRMKQLADILRMHL